MRVPVVALASLVALASCKKEAEPAPSPPPAAPPAPAHEQAAPVSPLTSVPASDTVLSLFEPEPAGCAWKRVDPLKKREAVVARFPVPGCVGARVGFAPSARAAVVWFDSTTVHSGQYGSPDAVKPGYPEEKPAEPGYSKAFLVDVSTGDIKPLPPPPVKEPLETLALDGQGRAIALWTEKLSDATIASGKANVGGVVVPLEKRDGLPAIAHAHALEPDGWKLVESSLTTTGWDYAVGARAVPVAAKLGPESFEVLTSMGSGEEPAADELVALKPFTPVDEGQWAKRSAGGSPYFVWTVTAEFSYVTGLLVTATPYKPFASLGFTSGDTVSLQERGTYLLVAGPRAGAHPRLYDVARKALVFSSDTARATQLWPAPQAAQK